MSNKPDVGSRLPARYITFRALDRKLDGLVAKYAARARKELNTRQKTAISPLSVSVERVGRLQMRGKYRNKKTGGTNKSFGLCLS
jgi:hypothetical protein